MWSLMKCETYQVARASCRTRRGWSAWRSSGSTFCSWLGPTDGRGFRRRREGSWTSKPARPWWWKVRRKTRRPVKKNKKLRDLFWFRKCQKKFKFFREDRIIKEFSFVPISVSSLNVLTFKDLQRIWLAYLDAGHVLRESFVLLADLEGQLAGVTHDNDRNLKLKTSNLLRKYENKIFLVRLLLLIREN